METNHAMDQAKAQMESIVEMVAARECDYDQLEVLKDELAGIEAAKIEAEEEHEAEQTEETADAMHAAIDEINAWQAEYGEELNDLSKAAGDCENSEEAEQRIQENPLSVEVRSGWHAPGGDNTPAEFMILLCTGGPAVRIIGDLDHYGQPCEARIEYQDWFTPWVELREGADRDALLTYCQQFYFEE